MRSIHTAWKVALLTGTLNRMLGSLLHDELTCSIGCRPGRCGGPER